MFLQGGHIPMRVVMSRTLNLPEDGSLWDTTVAPTLVMTQKGTRRDFQV
jgi:diaminohydroxyphosphoribosylaminopyrimidine deaminase/5-amino-6-(5-phosphoribosylamino)uracil reductase